MLQNRSGEADIRARRIYHDELVSGVLKRLKLGREVLQTRLDEGRRFRTGAAP
jgi:hypothetical protein